MAGYSILTRRDNPVRPLSTTPPVPVAEDRAADEPDILKLRPAATASEPPSGMPPVVMQLPEVSGNATSRKFPLASCAYWAAIVVGALVAVGLIFYPKKPPERAMDEAPAWSPAGTAPAASPVQEPPRSVEWSRPGGAAAETSDAAGEVAAPEVAPADAPVGIAPVSNASAGEAGEPARQDAPITTARVTGVRYRSETSPGQPGEATPLGISTPVAR